MADIRINALATTATTPASDDYLALDGTAQGTRKILATNIANNVTDVILGSSGPSVKSTLSARAPRQGLVFDGTAGATVTLPAFGTTDFTVAVWLRADVVAAKAVLDGNNGLLLDIGATGTFRFYSRAGSASLYTSSAGTIVAGKTNLLVYSRGSVYLNGVALQTGISDGANYTGSISHIGSSYVGGDPITGFVSALVYNRALSAAEVVALYEAGAPSGADYNSASNTDPVGAIPFVNENLSTFTATGNDQFTGTNAVGSRWAGKAASGRVTQGGKWRVRFTTSGTLTGNVKLSATGLNTSTLSAVTAITGGQTYDLVITATASAATAGIAFQSIGTGDNFTISGFSMYPIGLLLAPDAAQAGGGLVWYDTSGNAANITLPASGVSWNVPSSLKLGGNWTVAGTFTNISTAQLAHTYTGAPANFTFGTFDTSGNASLNVQSNANLLFATFNTERARIFANGNFGIGTGSTDGGQKLQVSGDVSVLASGSTIASFGRTATSPANAGWSAGADNDGGYISTLQIAKFRIFTGGTTALTLDSSQNATFAGQALSSVNAANATNFGNFVAANATLNAFGSYTSGASLDQKYWVWQSGSAVGDGVFRLRAINDGNTNGKNAIVVKRTGISSVIVNLPSLPTSSAGLAAGDLWNDSGTVKVV